MSFPARVAIDDKCDGCGKTEGRGVAFGPGKAVLCDDCLWSGCQTLDAAKPGHLSLDDLTAAFAARNANYNALGPEREAFDAAARRVRPSYAPVLAMARFLADQAALYFSQTFIARDEALAYLAEGYELYARLCQSAKDGARTSAEAVQAARLVGVSLLSKEPKS